jgi:hypothetical protein
LYDELVASLLAIEQRVSESKLDHLSASFEALSAVIGFLNADPMVVKAEATRALFRLYFAIYDLQRGANPKLLCEPTFHDGREEHVGAPTLTSVVLVRAHVAAAVLLLCESGMSRNDAARWLTAELDRSKIRQPNGKPINARLVLRWRDELNGKAPKGSDQVFRLIVDGMRRQVQDAQLAQPLSDAPFGPAMTMN